MAFATIPTAGAGRVLTSNQGDTSATRTFPSLSGLTKNSGDLLIAIVYAYQASGTSASFGSWGGGFQEFGDFGTSGSTVAIGCAYKWSTGSETGTFTVTQAGTPTGHASFILLSIPGAHASTPPESGGFATGTTTAANAGSFDPSGWASEDTLWIAVNANGMTNASGTWTANNGAPTNYTDYVGTNPTDTSTVGQVGGAVAFRQLNASSEDPAAFSQDTSNARSGAIVIAVRPGVVVWTGVTQSTLTLDEVTTGIRETFGQTAITETLGLVTAGYVPAGLQVSWGALETPAAVPTETGAVDSPFTFSATTAGLVDAKGQVALTETLGLTTTALVESHAATSTAITDSITTAAHLEAFSTVDLPVAYDATTTGKLDFTGRIDTPITFDAVTAGLIEAGLQVSWAALETPVAAAAIFGATSSTFTFDTVTAAHLTAKGAASLPITVSETVAAWVAAFSKVDTPIALGIVTQGTVAGQQFGVTTSTFTLSEVVAAKVEAKGAVVTPITLGEVVAGIRTTFGATANPYTVTIVVQGSLSGQQFGATSSVFTLDRVVTGTLTARGAVVTPITLDRVTAGAATRFGQVVLPVTLGEVVSGIAARTGSVVLSLSADETTVGRLGARGMVSLPLTVGSVAAGTAILFGKLQGVPVLVTVNVDGTINFVTMLDPIHTGILGAALNGGLGGIEQGTISDTVAGLAADVLQEVA